MRIELPRETERFGANQFFGAQKVYELDSGPRTAAQRSEEELIVRLPYEALYEIEKQMAIVVPVRGEQIKLIEGVLFGIPHQCLVIVVSNSPREPVDRFSMEKRALEHYARFARKDLIVVHQKDPLLGKAFAEAGYTDVLDETGVIKDGKAEGMLLAVVLARLAGKKYVGFVDSDNFFPGAVHEYIREYAAGFALSKSDYSMVRILWHSKPKIVGSRLYFARWGRTSIVTNRFLNRLISHYTGFETEVIKTGNAGEHALSMELAMRLAYSTGYSIEPYHFITLLEQFGGVEESPYPEVMQQQVEVYQIESRNPHMHDAKGEEHILQMIEAALSVIYHSPVCPDPLKRDIEEDLRRRQVIGKGEKPRMGTYYPPLTNLDLPAFYGALSAASYAPLLTAGPSLASSGTDGRKETAGKARKKEQKAS